MYRRLFLGAVGLSPFAAMAAEPLRAVASFSILGDIVRQVGGDRVAVTTIVPPNGDAHDYQPRPADARAIAAAGFVTMNGFDLDNWLARLAMSTRTNAALTVASRLVTPRTLPGSTVVDPHAWQDPRNGALYAIAIGDGLASADPPGDAVYRAAAERYAAEAMRLDVSIEARFAAIPVKARRIITTHDAFGYYGARYDIEFLSAQGLSTDAEPSARAIAALVAQIKREKIRAVFLENMTDPRLAQMLAREAGAVLGGTVYSDALSAADGPAGSYLEMLRYNTGLFVAAMRVG
jgi:zinc/manganese transport system substrate-binding protein